MECPLKLKKPNCHKCEYGKEGFCDFPFSIKEGRSGKDDNQTEFAKPE